MEDNAIIGLAEKLELEKYGYTVTHLTKGEEAVQLVLEGHEFYGRIKSQTIAFTKRTIVLSPDNAVEIAAS